MTCARPIVLAMTLLSASLLVVFHCQGLEGAAGSWSVDGTLRRLRGTARVKKDADQVFVRNLDEMMHEEAKRRVGDAEESRAGYVVQQILSAAHTIKSSSGTLNLLPAGDVETGLIRKYAPLFGVNFRGMTPAEWLRAVPEKELFRHTHDAVNRQQDIKARGEFIVAQMLKRNQSTIVLMDGHGRMLRAIFAAAQRQSAAFLQSLKVIVVDWDKGNSEFHEIFFPQNVQVATGDIFSYIRHSSVARDAFLYLNFCTLEGQVPKFVDFLQRRSTQSVLAGWGDDIPGLEELNKYILEQQARNRTWKVCQRKHYVTQFFRELQ